MKHLSQKGKNNCCTSWKEKRTLRRIKFWCRAWQQNSSRFLTIARRCRHQGRKLQQRQRRIQIQPNQCESPSLLVFLFWLYVKFQIWWPGWCSPQKTKNSDEVTYANGEITLLSLSGSVNEDPVKNRVDALHKVPDVSTTAACPNSLASILNLNEDPVKNHVDASHKVPDALTTATLPGPLASILNLNEDAVENSVDA